VNSPRNFNDKLFEKIKSLSISSGQPTKIWIVMWKMSKDPKIEIMCKKPDPEYWDFIECEVTK